MASLLDRPAFGPYCSCIGANRAYEPAALAIIAFVVTWACMGLIQLFGRGGAAPAPRPAKTEETTMAFLEIENVQKSFGAQRRGAELRPRRSSAASSSRSSGRRGCGKTTTLRMVAGFETPTAGRDPHRRPGRHRPAAEPAQYRHGVPGLRALPQHDGRRERRLRPQGRQAPGRARSRPRRGDADADQAAGARRPLSLSSSPAASSSASRWPARSPSSRRCCCSTSRCRRSTPRSASRCARRSAPSSASSASPPSTSPTTRKKRCRCPTASW